MDSRIYARVERNMVVELVETSNDIVAMFHADLKWVDVTSISGVSCGWTFTGVDLVPPHRDAAV